MEKAERNYHRTKIIEDGDEVVTIGYYWAVDDSPFEGGYHTEKQVVIDRRPVLRVIEEAS